MTVTQVDQHWYTDIYRNVVWSIGKGILWLLDGFFDIIDKIWRFEFFNNEYVNKVFGGAVIVAISWLTLKVIVEIIMNYIVKNDGRSNPLTIYRGIVLAIVMMFLIQPLFDFGHNLSTNLTNDVIAVSGLDSGSSAENSISSAIVRSMVYKDETKSSDIEYLVKNWKDVDINDTDGGLLENDVYKYSLNFFMLIVLAVVTIFLLFFVAIQMAKRVMEIALYKIIGPFCCTSLTNNGKSFETWIKSTIGLFAVTIVQFIAIGLLLAMFGSAFQDSNTMTGIFLVIGALLFIIGTPTIINSLFGQQSGMMSAFGDMQSLIAIGQASTQGLELATAGSKMALSFGSNVVSGGANLVKGGVSNFSNMLNKSSSLTTDQMGALKETMKANNTYKANQQLNDFLGGSNIRSNPYMNRFNVGYNPIYNQYMNQSELQRYNKKGGGI